MKIAIRGEGRTDMGTVDNGLFIKGPMVTLIEKLDCYKKLYTELGCTDKYNYIEWEYISKRDIMTSPKRRRNMISRGKKAEREMGTDTDVLKSFYNNSESFAVLAKEIEADITIFFVDTDKDSFEDRYKQVSVGLSRHGYDETGVPMIPTKISEAWLMCCLSDYQNCGDHENATTDKESPNYPKNVCNKDDLNTYIIAENCDPNRIDMPSFNRFKEDFTVAVNSYIHGTCE